MKIRPAILSTIVIIGLVAAGAVLFLLSQGVSRRGSISPTAPQSKPSAGSCSYQFSVGGGNCTLGFDAQGAPTPTPAPFLCLNLSKDIAAPKIGDSVRFTCGTVSNATRYEFAYRINGGTQQTLAASTTGSNVSVPLTISSNGTYQVQCQACNGSTCTGYEAW